MLPSPTTEASEHLDASIRCDLEEVRPVARRIHDFLAAHGATPEEVMSCELAFVEACNNAILYTPKTAQDQLIEVEVTCNESQIGIIIRDHTTGFIMPEDVNLPQSENESGRGLYIIRSVMDQATYTNGVAGNTMQMIKCRSYQPSIALKPSAPTLSDYSRRLAESEQVISEMAEELSSCYETLSAIFRCGAELGKTNNIASFAKALCTDLLQITESDWYVLRVLSEESPQLVVFTTSSSTAQLKPLPVTALHESTETRAAKTRHDVWFDCKNRIPCDDPLAQFGSDCQGLTRPLVFADNLVGTLTVGKAPGRSPFTAAQANIVHTFGDFLAIQFINSRLQEEQLKHKLVSRELEIAKSIQVALLPKTLPQPCGFGLAGYCEFARTVGGDFYDVVPVSQDSLLLIIADVMGKGIPAAMFAAILRSVLRAAPELNQHPAGLLSRVNHLLYDELSEVEMFITAQLVFVDFSKRELTVASAGHCPLLLGTSDSREVKSISPEGMPLGILPETHFAAHVESLPENARLLLYTDGITDARNASGRFFGEERLFEWFKADRSADSSADELKHSLAETIRQFQGEAAPFDDQTFLILAEQNFVRREKCPKKS